MHSFSIAAMRFFFTASWLMLAMKLRRVSFKGSWSGVFVEALMVRKVSLVNISSLFRGRRRNMRIIDPVSQRIIDIFRQPLGLPRTANINPRIDARFETCKIVTCGKPLDVHSPKTTMSVNPLRTNTIPTTAQRVKPFCDYIETQEISQLRKSRYFGSLGRRSRHVTLINLTAGVSA